MRWLPRKLLTANFLAWLIIVAPPSLAAQPASTAINVTIDGIDGAVQENARKSLSLIPAAAERALSADEVRSLHLRAEKEIRDSLQPFGYYAARVHAQLLREKATWQAHYRVTLGTPTRLRRVDIQYKGACQHEKTLTTLLQKHTLKTGTQLNHPQYEALKSALLETVVNAGCVDAKLTRHELRVNPTAHTADIHLTLDTGPRFRFGPITVEQSILDAAIVSRYVTIQPGEPFAAERLLDLQFSLSDSDYFDAVNVDLDREHSTNQQIPVVITASPRKRHRYSAGLGYGTDTGARVSLGLERRWVNRKGHRLRGDLRLSERKNTLAMQYIMPVGNIKRDYWALNLNVEQSQDLGDGKSRAGALGIQRTQPWHDWVRKLYLNLQRERFNFGGGPDQFISLVMPGITLSRTATDNPLFPRRGWSLLADLRGASTDLASDSSFAQLRLTAHWIRELGPRSRLLLRGDIGVTEVDNFSALPATLRYFAGGDQSVRGYSYQSLGPRDAQGLVIGGTSLLVGSIEADHYFLQKSGDSNWGVAAFFDAGNAGNDTNYDLARGVGLGLRWRSPVGMVRADVAKPLDDDIPDARLHLSIGNDL